MKRFFKILIVLVVSIVILLYTLNTYYSAQELYSLKGGERIGPVIIDEQGTFRQYPGQNTRMSYPFSLSLNAAVGDVGHVSVGLLGLLNKANGESITSVGFTMTLNKFEVTSDTGLVRLGLATSWTDGHSLMSDSRQYKHWYVEFDIWNSPVMESYLIFNTIYWRDGGTNDSYPTTLIKTYQLTIGDETTLKIDVDRMFHSAYSDVDGKLDAVYFVVEKSDPRSSFSFDFTVSDLRVFR
jgi:hypothetical protein